ncbi:hypothetical protein BDA96_09G247200 [Sorghum bicolor]|uniref:Uncharacterized protein ycf23 n=1 Tax=Sorghum bicolor TaxID=4558 RepID=A0A921U576_SORBI|nr:hypothetical protein BDA96_09G247200 [Sorghum bicolor]
MAAPGSLGLLHAPSFAAAKCQPVASRASARRAPRALFAVRASAADAANKDAVLKAFRENRALKIISGLQNFDRSSVASVVTAADKGGATHVDIACDKDLVKLAMDLTNLPICVSSVDPSAFHSAVEEGADIIQTEGGKCSSPTKPGVLGLIEKATPTLAAAYSISRAVSIPVMCSSGLSSVTAPMAVTAGAAGVGVGSAINKLNDVVAMIAEVRSIAQAMGLAPRIVSENLRTVRH